VRRCTRAASTACSSSVAACSTPRKMPLLQCWLHYVPRRDWGSMFQGGTGDQQP
jgi:hypothetical protein